MIYSKYK